MNNQKILKSLSEKDLSKVIGGGPKEEAKKFAKGYGMGLIAPPLALICGVKHNGPEYVGFSLGNATTIGLAACAGAGVVGLSYLLYENKNRIKNFFKKMR